MARSILITGSSHGIGAGCAIAFAHPGLYNSALKCSPLINAAVSCMEFTNVQLWGRGRDLPEFAKESFQTMWKKGKVK